MKYAILNEENIAFNILNYSVPLINKPDNYIIVENDLMLWHKYVNGIWSTESYEPAPVPPVPSQMDNLQSTCDLILLKQEGIL